MTSVEVWGGKHKSHNVFGGMGFRPQGCNPIPHFPGRERIPERKQIPTIWKAVGLVLNRGGV